MNEKTRAHRPRTSPGRRAESSDPAVAALTELIVSERARAMLEEPGLVEQADPGRTWLLWFAIGATGAVCRLVGRDANTERDRIFRQLVAVIFAGKAARSPVDHVYADKRLIELFESAGAEAVGACMRGEKRLGYYLEALCASGRRDL